MELNREQIVKALDAFHNRILSGKLAEKVTESEMMAVVDALALIRELTEENERLTALLDARCDRCIERERADTVRKMQERLKEKRIKPEFPWDDFFITETDIDQIAKELLEDNT